MQRWIFYHWDCLDGFGAAYAAWMKFGYKGAVYRACQYSEGEDPFDMCDPGDEVFVVDFSFKREILLRQAQRLKIQVIDHHATAQKDLEGLDFCIFDMTKSGAVLAWEFFHPGVPVPKLLLHVQDRDLWQFKIPWTKEITTALMSLSYNFELWKKHIDDPTGLAEVGSIQVAVIGEQVRYLTERQGWLNVKGHRVPAANSHIHRSELGHSLLERCPDAAFSVVFYDYQDTVAGVTKWMRTYSLRAERGFDAGDLARSFGGGGHKNAAGFTVNLGAEAYGHPDIDAVP